MPEPLLPVCTACCGSHVIPVMSSWAAGGRHCMQHFIPSVAAHGGSHWGGPSNYWNTWDALTHCEPGGPPSGQVKALRITHSCTPGTVTALFVKTLAPVTYPPSFEPRREEGRKEGREQARRHLCQPTSPTEFSRVWANCWAFLELLLPRERLLYRLSVRLVCNNPTACCCCTKSGSKRCCPTEAPRLGWTV